VIPYAESSAVLAWLLGEPDGAEVAKILRNTTRVVTSAITGVECARALVRGAATERLTSADELAALRLLDTAERSWTLLDVTERILDRARVRFPNEPVRTLDALHLATAVSFREALGSVTMVSLDERVRSNARGLGLEVAPI
jgi:predicted nucleic acid-binding protein